MPLLGLEFRNLSTFPKFSATYIVPKDWFRFRRDAKQVVECI